jgi:hypothetical protein
MFCSTIAAKVQGSAGLLVSLPLTISGSSIAAASSRATATLRLSSP